MLYRIISPVYLPKFTVFYQIRGLKSWKAKQKMNLSTGHFLIQYLKPALILHRAYSCVKEVEIVGLSRRLNQRYVVVKDLGQRERLFDTFTRVDIS